MSRLLRITALTGALFCFAVFVRADSPEISIEQLIKALDDENLRRGASIALAKRKKQVVPALRKSLASNHRNRRVWAAFTLGEIGPAANSAVEDLTHSLEHEDDALRAATAQAIGKIGPAARSSVRALADSLGDENADVRRKSIAALGRVGPLAGKAAPELINSLKDAEVRQAAKDALIQIGEPAVAALREALNDDALRFDVREILRQIDPGQPGAGQPVLADLASLRAALHDLTRSPRERAAAAAELASLDKPGVAVLIEAFEKEVIASAASKAFATVGPSALDALI
ncbi:MAG: HEAT repeat domain-containing protein, partial [Planctomycetales bacterium]